MAEVTEEHCSNTQKPPRTKACRCAELLCVGDPDRCPQEEAQWFEPETPYSELGCFSLAHGHDDGHSDSLLDLSCVGYKGATPCKSGLPFYSMHSNAMSPSLCFGFCTSKGFDIFGLLKNTECRCGFSEINRNARMRGPSVPQLQFELAGLETFKDASGICPLRVFRYSGYFEAGGIPMSLVKLEEDDLQYFHKVFHSHQRDMDEDVIYSTHAPTSPPAMDVRAESEPVGHPWDRDCFPANCGPGGGVWPHRQPEAPEGVYDQFREYSVIPYFFSENLDDARKEVFRTAARHWHAVTCVVLVEKQREEIHEPAIEVLVDQEDRCFVNRIGYPGYWENQPQLAFVNLGWCNNLYFLGNVIHEIGHVLGMNHEQKRMDATQKVNHHGPYLHIFWDSLEDQTKRNQYLPDTKTYMGSDLQDMDDPHHGYAAYDYGSIMHYGRNGRFEPIMDENAELLGNRDHLSESDIIQVNDMYQCKEKVTQEMDRSCNFEVSLCNWVNVGKDSAHWRLWQHRSGGPASGVHSSSFAYAEAKGHPWEGFILQSPVLEKFKKYQLRFSYFLSSKDTELTVEYESVLGKSEPVFRAEDRTPRVWHHQELTIFGDRAITVRFVVLTTDNVDSGAAIDNVNLVLRGHSEVDASDHQKTLLEEVKDAFENLLDSIFSRKYDSRPSPTTSHPEASAGSALLWAASGVALAAVALLLVCSRPVRRRRYFEEEMQLKPAFSSGETLANSSETAIWILHDLGLQRIGHPLKQSCGNILWLAVSKNTTENPLPRL